MASNKGAPTIQKTVQFQNQMKEARSTPVAFTDFREPTPLEKQQVRGMMGLGADEAEVEKWAFKMVNSNKYPSRPVPTDDRSTDWKIRQDLVAANMITSARPMPFTEGEIEYIKDRSAAEEYAAYQSWLAQRYDLNDVATRALFKQIAPSYFTSRKEVLKELMDNHAKYAYLVMSGPDSEADLQFQYEVETGKRAIAKGPFYDPIEWAGNEIGWNQRPAMEKTPDQFKRDLQDYNKHAYEYGMFNPMKPQTPSEAGWTQNPVNASSIVGNPNARFYGFPGQSVPTDHDWGTQYGGVLIDGHRRGMIGNRNQVKEGALADSNWMAMGNRGAYETTINNQQLYSNNNTNDLTHAGQYKPYTGMRSNNA